MATGMPGSAKRHEYTISFSYMPRMKSFDVAIIGSGHNGLACAALLAKAGLRVVVCERSDRLGGATVSDTDVWPGYTISAASYVCSLLDPWLVKELDLTKHGYHAYRKDPASFTPMRDGRSLLLGSDHATNAQEISAFDPADVAGFAAFEAEATRLGSLLFETFADEDPSFERFDAQTQALLRGSAADLVEKFVKTPVLQATLATDGLIGTNRGPRDAGTGYILAHHYAGRALGAQGAWGFVRGGMGGVSAALASAARSFGAEILTDASVARIVIRENRVQGVILENGREIDARCVASNAHPRTTLLGLAAGAEMPSWLRDKIVLWRTTGASLKLNLALGELPNFTARPGSNMQAHHRATIHVAPSLDYLQKAFEDGRTEGASPEPMLECFMQTPTEPDLAPPGKHILSIFAQYFPYDRDDRWSTDARENITKSIIETLAQYAPNIPSAIEAQQLLAPPDLESRFGLVGGNIFHGELLPGQIYENRFNLRTPIDGLYLCGSGTHPGGCVSGFPGRRAAQAIVNDLVTVTS